MEIPRKTPTPEDARIGQMRMQTFAEQYRCDEGLRARCGSGELAEVVTEFGVANPSPGTELRLVEDTDSILHVVLPPDPNLSLSDDMLTGVSGGAAGPPVTCAASASTVGTVPSTVFSVGTASTICPD